MFDKKQQGKSIEEQAQEVRSKELAKKIDSFSTDVSSSIIAKLKTSDFEIGTFNIIMKAINEKTANWFNNQINNRSFKDMAPKEDENS